MIIKTVPTDKIVINFTHGGKRTLYIEDSALNELHQAWLDRENPRHIIDCRFEENGAVQKYMINLSQIDSIRPFLGEDEQKK